MWLRHVLQSNIVGKLMSQEIFVYLRASPKSYSSASTSRLNSVARALRVGFLYGRNFDDRIQMKLFSQRFPFIN